MGDGLRRGQEGQPVGAGAGSRAGHPGASDLLVKAVVSEKPRGQGQTALRRPPAQWSLQHIRSTILNEKEYKKRIYISV